MPYNPGGLFSLVASYFATAGQTIRTEQHNPPLEDIASALSNVLVRDGRAPMTGPLNMNGQVINNVAVGSAPSSVATLAQAVPIGGGVDYWGPTAPPLWLFAAGQAVSRTTYTALFAVIGTTYGIGDGSTTFNLPNKSGRVSAGRDNMSGTDAGILTSATMAPNGTTRGAIGGTQTVAITQANLPNVTLATAIAAGQGAHNHTDSTFSGTNLTSPGGSGAAGTTSETVTGTSTLPAMTGTTPLGGTGVEVNNVQPTIVCNYIIYAGA